MSEPLKRVRLPPEALAWEARLQLRRWIDGRGWDTAPRYAMIESARDTWLGLGHPDLADDPQMIATAIFAYVLKDEQFQHHVIHTAKQTLTDPADWDGAARAYAWVVLQRYNKELGGQDE